MPRVQKALIAVALVLALVSCARRPSLTQTPAPSAGGSWTGQGPSGARATPSAQSAGARTNGAGQAVARASDTRQGGTRPPDATAVGPGVARVAPDGFKEVPELRVALFDFDKYDIRPDAAKVLRDNAVWLKSRPADLVLIEGHADERGTFEYNLALGDRRAASTKAFLVRQGVRADRITTISYGEARPTCTAQTEECWARNRRGQLRIKAR